MFGLEATADEFDRMYNEVQKLTDNALLVRPARATGEYFGADSNWNVAIAIFPAIAWSIATFTMNLGKGLVDVLRLGEGARTGTASGWFHDGLRVLNVLPAAEMIGKGIGGQPSHRDYRGGRKLRQVLRRHQHVDRVSSVRCPCHDEPGTVWRALRQRHLPESSEFSGRFLQ